MQTFGFVLTMPREKSELAQQLAKRIPHMAPRVRISPLFGLTIELDVSADSREAARQRIETEIAPCVVERR